MSCDLGCTFSECQIICTVDRRNRTEHVDKEDRQEKGGRKVKQDVAVTMLCSSSDIFTITHLWSRHTVSCWLKKVSIREIFFQTNDKCVTCLPTLWLKLTLASRRRCVCCCAALLANNANHSYSDWQFALTAWEVYKMHINIRVLGDKADSQLNDNTVEMWPWQSLALPAGQLRWGAGPPGKGQELCRWKPLFWCCLCRSKRTGPSSISARHRSALDFPS